MLNKLIKILVVPAVALSLSACGINSVPTAEENAKAPMILAMPRKSRNLPQHKARFHKDWDA